MQLKKKKKCPTQFTEPESPPVERLPDLWGTWRTLTFGTGGPTSSSLARSFSGTPNPNQGRTPLPFQERLLGDAHPFAQGPLRGTQGPKPIQGSRQDHPSHIPVSPHTPIRQGGGANVQSGAVSPPETTGVGASFPYRAMLMPTGMSLPCAASLPPGRPAGTPSSQPPPPLTHSGPLLRGLREGPQAHQGGGWARGTSHAHRQDKRGHPPPGLLGP